MIYYFNYNSCTDTDTYLYRYEMYNHDSKTYPNNIQAEYAIFHRDFHDDESYGEILIHAGEFVYWVRDRVEKTSVIKYTGWYKYDV